MRLKTAATWLLACALLSAPSPGLVGLAAAQPSPSIKLPGTKAASLPDACGSAFSQALTSCEGSPTDKPTPACCAGLRAAGGECLRLVLGYLQSSDQAAANGMSATIVSGCRIPLGGDGAKRPGGLVPGARLEHAWSVEARPGTAACYNYRPTPQGNFTLDRGVGPWAAAGKATPSKTAVDKIYTQLCGKDTAASSKAVLQALATGGAAAQAAVAAIARGTCPADEAALEASFYRFVSLPELQNPKTALQYAQAFVAAAEATGAGACVTLASVDAAGFLQGSLRLHTSLNRRSAGAGASGWGSGSGSVGTGAGGSGPAATSSLALPDGQIDAHISYSPKPVACYEYTPGQGTVGNWSVDPTAKLYGGTGSSMPPTALIERIGAAICTSPEEGGAVLLAALAEGGEAAQAAVKALLAPGCTLANAADAAIGALGATPELSDPKLVMGYVQALVQAADQVGTAMCFSIVVVDPSDGRVLASETVHTGGNATAPGGAAAAQAPAAAANGSAASPPPSQAAGLVCMNAISRVLDLCIEGGGIESSGGPKCCAALRALGPPCLGQLVAVVQSGEGGQTELATGIDDVLAACGADTEPGSAAACAGGFKAAVEACPDPPDAGCCAAIDLLGQRCLERLTGDPSLAEVVQAIVAACAKPAGKDDKASSGSTSGGASGGVLHRPLPEGNVITAWSVGQLGQCSFFNATSGDWQNGTTLPFRGSGFLPAPPRAVAAAAARFCSAPKAAPGALLKALDGGGAGARAAVAALLEGCPQGGLDIMNSVLAELVDSEEMQSPATTYGYVRAFVDAADDVGVGACVTLVVVDERGQVLLSEQVHTGGSAWVGAGAGAGSGATLGGGGSSGSGSITEEVVVVRYWRAALPASGGPGEPG